MKTLLTIIALVALSGVATAQTFEACYGWEDGGTALGEYGGNVEYINDGTNVSEGTSALRVREIADGSGQIFVAWVCGLSEGDVVSASFDAFDDIDGSPSVRIWGSYSEAGDITAYTGSAGGNGTYSGAEPWVNLAYDYTMPAGQTCLVIQCRPYGSAPYDTFNWLDNLCLTVPAGAHIWFPGGTVDNEEDAASWGAVKAMYK